MKSDSSTETWQRLDGAHHVHPFTDMRAMIQAGGTRVITRGQGVYLYDSKGHQLLDGMAGLWCVAIGYGRTELARAAQAQMEQLPYYTTFLHTATPPSIELAARLAELTPAGLDRVFYANSGSEANDSLVRMILRFWQIEGRPEKTQMIGCELAYHGSTLAASSLGGMKGMHQQGGLLPGFHHVIPPYHYAYGNDEEPEAFGLRAANALETKIREIGPERVAAFFAEPFQGAGGVLIPPPTYWPRVQAICREYDVLLVADEVISGFGRTGRWFGCETFGIEPDLMTLAKGLTSGYLPLSAAVAGPRVADRLVDEGGVFHHGFTYSGHPVSCAVALENLRILSDEGIVDRVASETGPYLQRRLHETFDDHPMVGQVRGLGLVAALELTANKKNRTAFDPVGKAAQRAFLHGLENGVIVRAIRDVLAISPPLIITCEQIDELIERLGRAVDLTAKELDIG